MGKHRINLFLDGYIDKIMRYHLRFNTMQEYSNQINALANKLFQYYKQPDQGELEAITLREDSDTQQPLLVVKKDKWGTILVYYATPLFPNAYRDTAHLIVAQKQAVRFTSCEFDLIGERSLTEVVQQKDAASLYIFDNDLPNVCEPYKCVEMAIDLLQEEFLEREYSLDIHQIPQDHKKIQEMVSQFIQACQENPIEMAGAALPFGHASSFRLEIKLIWPLLKERGILQKDFKLYVQNGLELTYKFIPP